MKFQFTVGNQNSQYKEKHSLTNSLNSDSPQGQGEFLW